MRASVILLRALVRGLIRAQPSASKAAQCQHKSHNCQVFYPHGEAFGDEVILNLRIDFAWERG